LQTIDVLTKVNPINLDRSGTTDVTMNVSVKTVLLDITCATIGILNMASTGNINFWLVEIWRNLLMQYIAIRTETAWMVYRGVHNNIIIFILSNIHPWCYISYLFLIGYKKKIKYGETFSFYSSTYDPLDHLCAKIMYWRSWEIWRNLCTPKI
jgi:hypothetical protein